MSGDDIIVTRDHSQSCSTDLGPGEGESVVSIHSLPPDIPTINKQQTKHCLM